MYNNPYRVSNKEVWGHWESNPNTSPEEKMYFRHFLTSLSIWHYRGMSMTVYRMRFRRGCSTPIYYGREYACSKKSQSPDCMVFSA